MKCLHRTRRSTYPGAGVRFMSFAYALFFPLGWCSPPQNPSSSSTRLNPRNVCLTAFLSENGNNYLCVIFKHSDPVIDVVSLLVDSQMGCKQMRTTISDIHLCNVCLFVNTCYFCADFVLVETHNFHFTREL